MAKKGGQASLQVEVSSDDEWEALLERKGLVVVDVFTDWCGPCVGMMSNLKKVKLELGSDLLHLAMANSDKIAKLERFRGRSEPTWVFIGSGQLLRVMYGSNAPVLMNQIAEELQNELDAIEGKRERVFYPFDQLTPDEKLKLAEYEAKKAAEMAQELAELEARQDKVKRRYLGKVARKFLKFSLVVFFPNSIEKSQDPNGRKTSPAAYKLMSLYDTVGLTIRDQLEMQLSKDDIHELFYNSGYNLPQKVYDSMLKEPVIVSLVQTLLPLKITRASDLTTTASYSVSANSFLDFVEENLCLLVYGPNKKPTEAESDSIYKMFETIDADGDILPPCWTPTEHISKCAAARVVFPSRIEALKVKEIDVPPPSLIMIFEGERAQEVLDVCKPFSSEVVHLGYFDSVNAEDAKKICSTVHELEAMSDEAIDTAKLVIALSKEQSDPTLIMTQLGPVYVSPDIKTADREVELFFPPFTIEEEDEPDPWGPPPPPPPPVWIDENGNEYLEIYISNALGESRRVRKLVKLYDGTEVEFGDVEEIPPEEVLEIEERERRELIEKREQRRKERQERKLAALKRLQGEEESEKASTVREEEEGEGEVEEEVEEEQTPKMGELMGEEEGEVEKQE
ncbi:uncharacterized protein isoform X2 [Rhodnius prolixus]